MLSRYPWNPFETALVLKSQIKPGVQYALRERRSEHLQRVKILEHIRGNKWKAEWIDPNPGLVHFVESGQLLVPWKDHKAFLREEANAAALSEHNDQQGYKRDSPLENAVCEIFESTGETEDRSGRGVLAGTSEAIDRKPARAGVEARKNSPYAYTDRQGRLHLPQDENMILARPFCAAEPATVMTAAEG